MILLLNTATPVCYLTLVDGDKIYNSEWQANRELAKGLLAYLKDELERHGKQFSDLSGIGVFKGPGSFTGLRIGLTVLNTMADALAIPIVGASGEDWQTVATDKLERGENGQIVLPLYSSDAHITSPRK